MNKIDLTSLEQLEQINQASYTQPQLLYKHSTTCGLCDIMWEEVKNGDFDLNYLDLHKYRPISNEIEKKYDVLHESPQVLIIKDGKCVYHTSHRKINAKEIENQLTLHK